MNERSLWAAAARVIMEDAARIIRAARKQERVTLDLICDLTDTREPVAAILARFGRAIEPHLPADVIQRHRERRARRANG